MKRNELEAPSRPRRRGTRRRVVPCAVAHQAPMMDELDDWQLPRCIQCAEDETRSGCWIGRCIVVVRGSSERCEQSVRVRVEGQRSLGHELRLVLCNEAGLYWSSAAERQRGRVRAVLALTNAKMAYASEPLLCSRCQYEPTRAREREGPAECERRSGARRLPPHSRRSSCCAPDREPESGGCERVALEHPSDAGGAGGRALAARLAARQPRGRAFATEHVRIGASQWISRLSSPPALSLPLAPLAPAALQHAFRRGWRAAEQIPRPSERGTAVPERRQTGIGDLSRGTRREGWTVGRVGAKLSDTSVPPVGHNLQTGPQFLSIVRSSLSLARTLCRAFARSLRSACAPPPPHSFAHSCIWRLAYRVISSRYPPPSFPFHSRASTLSLSHALLHHERRRRKF